MTTPALQNNLIIAASPAPNQTTRNNDAPAPEASFNRQLSNEIAERRNLERSQNDSAKAPENNPVRSQTPASDQPKNADAPTPPVKKSSKDETDDADSSKAQNTATDNPYLSPQLQALVAQLAQNPAADAAAAAKTDTNPALAALDGRRTAASSAKGSGEAAALSADQPADAAIGTDPAQRDATLRNLLDRAQPGGKKSAIDTDQFANKPEQSTSTRPSIDLSNRPVTNVDTRAIAATLDANLKTETLNDGAALKNLTALSDNAPPGLATPITLSIDKLQTAAGQVSDKLAPPVGTAAWDQALGQKVTWLVAGGHQSASLTLNPPDLGPLQIVLNVNNSQADASFTAAQPEVRQALEAALPKLREMLSEAGIQLGQANVSSGQSNRSGESSSRSQRGRDSGLAGADDIAPIGVVRGGNLSIGGNGLVDTFA